MPTNNQPVLNQELRNGQFDSSSYSVDPAATVVDGKGIMSAEDAGNAGLSLRITSVTKMPGVVEPVVGDPQMWTGGTVNKFGDPVYPQFGTSFDESDVRPEWIYWRVDTLGNNINIGWEAVETTP